MAIATRQLATMAFVNHEELDSDDFRIFNSNTYGLWKKDKITIGGEDINFSLDTQQDCLETFDFVYLFLLKKIIPFERVDSWTNENSYTSTKYGVQILPFRGARRHI